MENKSNENFLLLIFYVKVMITIFTRVFLYIIYIYFYHILLLLFLFFYSNIFWRDRLRATFIAINSTKSSYCFGS